MCVCVFLERGIFKRYFDLLSAMKDLFTIIINVWESGALLLLIFFVFNLALIFMCCNVVY